VAVEDEQPRLYVPDMEARTTSERGGDVCDLPGTKEEG
jgi:hypothetical protein